MPRLHHLVPCSLPSTLRRTSSNIVLVPTPPLRLTDVEREHLYDLARTAPVPTPARRTPATQPAVRASVQRVLDSMTVPAIVYDAAQDLVAANLMGAPASPAAPRKVKAKAKTKAAAKAGGPAKKKSERKKKKR